jgi:hypothetical protein
LLSRALFLQGVSLSFLLQSNNEYRAHAYHMVSTTAILFLPPIALAASTERHGHGARPSGLPRVRRGSAYAVCKEKKTGLFIDEKRILIHALLPLLVSLPRHVHWCTVFFILSAGDLRFAFFRLDDKPVKERHGIGLGSKISIAD